MDEIYIYFSKKFGNKLRKNLSYLFFYNKRDCIEIPQSYVVFAPHFSNKDWLYISKTIKNQERLFYIAKKNSPFFLNLIGAIKIYRLKDIKKHKNFNREFIKKAKEYNNNKINTLLNLINEGYSLLIFPEGERNKGFKHIKLGIFRKLNDKYFKIKKENLKVGFLYFNKEYDNLNFYDINYTNIKDLTEKISYLIKDSKS